MGGGGGVALGLTLTPTYCTCSDNFTVVAVRKIVIDTTPLHARFTPNNPNAISTFCNLYIYSHVDSRHSTHTLTSFTVYLTAREWHSGSQLLNVKIVYRILKHACKVATCNVISNIEMLQNFSTCCSCKI